jgi:NAD(P)-dependent dehydrogenase (short-subunit alcohol dehydrogenase family)
MSAMLLRDELLTGRAVALAGGPCAHVPAALATLGARVETMPELDGEVVGEWAAARAPLHALVYVARGDALKDFLAGAWVAVREVAVGALIPSGSGKIVLVAPPRQRPVQAALENLARTLSVEWARYGVTTAMLAPGDRAREADVAQIVCYLVSEAGGYFSGARFDVGVVAPTG